MDRAIMLIPYYLWLPVAVTLVVIGFVFYMTKKCRKTLPEYYKAEAFDVEIPSMGIIRGNTFIHQWDPRIKLASGILFSFFSVSLKSFSLLLLSTMWALFFCLLAKLPSISIKRRLRPIFALTTALVVLLPITAPIRPDSRLVIFEPFASSPLNYDAFLGAITIGIKATTVVLITTLILETSPYTATIMALNKIGVPGSLAHMLLLTYRYIFVLIDEAKRMQRAMKLRGFEAKASLETLRIIGSFIGTLFVRSFERIQRITEAMEMRGYRGHFPEVYPFEARTKDWMLGMLWLAISVGLYTTEYFHQVIDQIEGLQ